MRGLSFSSQLSREAELPLPRDAKMTDVPCHSWIMPTLLKHAGSISCISAATPPAVRPQVPRAVLVGGPGWLAAADDVFGRRLRHRPVPPADWPHQTWLALDPHRRQSRPADARRGREAARRGASEAARRQGPHRPAVGFRRCDPAPRRPSCRWCAATCPTRGSTARCAIRSARDRPRTSGRPSRPPSRSTRISDSGASKFATPPHHRAAYEKSLLYGEHTWGGRCPGSSRTARTCMVSTGHLEKDRAPGRFDASKRPGRAHGATSRAARI